MKYCGSGLTMEASLPHETASGAPQTTVPSEWLDECLDEPKSEIKYCEQKERKLRNASKPHSTPRTLKWLEENYELAEGVCIPRSTLYVHYLDYCEKTDTQPVNAASFGKIIRQQFQHITTRRLGTRGQSKYHYYGIGIKDNSIYYELMYSKNGVQNNQDGRKDAGIKPIVAYSPRSKLGTLLPEFPDIAELKLPQSVAEDKVRTFVMMYRTHCQRILDTVIRANFEEVQNFLLHFWQGMPSHIVPILGTPVVVNLVGVCDSILYKAVSGVLMPTVLQALPESLTQVIRKFAKQLDDWLRVALEGLPDALRHMKLDLARRFGQVLRRQTSLNHLCQAARTVLHSADIVAQMLDDWAAVDLASICKQTLYTMDSYSPREHQTIIALYKEFEQLLADSAPIEAYTEWLEAMVTRCVVRPAAVANAARQQCGGGSAVRRIARQFLLMWSCFGTRVIRDMTLHSAPSFGSFHLLHLMFDDYVLYLVEALHSEERVRDLLRIIRGEQTTSEEGDDLALPRPSFHGLDGSLSLPTSSPMMPGMERHSVITDTRDVYTHMGTYGPAGLPAHAHDNTSPAQSVNSYELQTTDELIQIGSPHGLATADSQSGNFAEYRYGVGRSDGTGYSYPYTQAQYQGYMGRSYNGRYNSEWDYSTMIGSNCQSDQLASGQSYEGFERGNSSYSLASYGSYDLRNSNQPVIWPDGSIAAGGYYESSENSNMANLHSQSRKRKSTSVDNVDNKRNASNIIDFQFDMATAYGNT